MKRLLPLILCLTISLIATAQRATKTIFRVSGLATPVKIVTDKGTYQISNSREFTGLVNPLSATDANGDVVVVPQNSYYTRNGVHVREYVFKTLYYKPGSSTSSSSYRKNDSQARQERREERRERAQEALEQRIFSFQKSVDLGLPSGTIWAGYNLGASSPLEAGNLYAWGETSGNGHFDLIHYFDYWDDGYLTYNYSGNALTKLLPQHDAANKIWGGNWQLPTDEDIKELVDNCQRQAGEYKGVVGFKLTGPNGNSIFFPIFSKSIKDWSVSLYWTNELGSDGSHTAACIIASDQEGLGTSFYPAYADRYVGAFIRPIWKDQKPTATSAQLAKMKQRPANAVQQLQAKEAEEKARQAAEYERKSQTTKSTVSGSGKLKSVTPGNGRVTFNVAGQVFDLIKVNGGSFTMGATKIQENDCDDEDEKPAHTVNLSDFYIGKFEVTRELWTAIMGPIHNEDDDGDHAANEPMSYISFNDVCEFIKEINKATGLTFRLPTEAEWEYAAKGGANNEGNKYKYSGSNNIDDVAWYGSNSYKNWGSAHLQPVGTKAPNSLGIYDMSGNVDEFVNGTFEDYKRKTETNPIHNDPDYVPVVRGGHYWKMAGACRTTYRDGTQATTKSGNHGFRLAMDDRQF